ncbi:MAG TPA: HD domain-containing protein [Candidatus Saccharimonadales bacterium]|nr:HD domain-containing protein [Candidatus Saccharimonadales bacterium]
MKDLNQEAIKLPMPQQIEALHHKYAPSAAAFDLVFTHCNIVSEIAAQCIADKRLTVDDELVKVGCLLHDIGVYPLLDKSGKEREGIHYITHGIRGEAILREEGFPETICRFASHHTGVGLTKQDIVSQKLPLPLQDYEAETKEEELIMYADKFHSKLIPPCFNTYEYYKKSVAKFGQDKAERFEQMAQEFGVPDLAPFIEKYGHAVRG